jgi:anion-transporting  ArsA/GET3 family ATPase
VEWDSLFDRQILIVSGKGGTGKSTVAAALAMRATATGRTTLLVEVEGREEVTKTLGIPDQGFSEAPTRWGFSVLSITPQAAALEYLHLFFGMDRVSRPLARAGVFDQIIGGAPGFRDLLTCGKLFEIARLRRTDPRVQGRPTYDCLIVDAPPTGQLASFLAAPAAFFELIRVGRMKRQAAGVDRLLRTAAQVVLVAVPEEMAVAETLEAIPAIRKAGVRVAAVIANQCLPSVVPPRLRGRLGRLDPEELRSASSEAGLDLVPGEASTLLEEARNSDRRYRSQRGFVAELRGAGPMLSLPEFPPAGPPSLVVSLAALMAGGSPLAGNDQRGGRQRVAAALPQTGEALADILAGARIVVVCGSGGVGKTTISAALAVGFAERRRRTALLTVDPARRLATALHLPMAPGEPTEVRLGRGRRLIAMQLDTQRTFDELIHRNAGSADREARILSNPFYRKIADSLSGTHEYMAMEKLYELATEGDEEAIVIDTPPTRSALSFLEAPARMTDFLGGRFLRWVLWPGARAGRLTMGVARFGAAAFARTVGRLVGAEVLSDTVEFLSAFEGMYGGFKERAARVLELLRSDECEFVIVTAPNPASLEEAGYFVERLAIGGMRAAAVVVNRFVTPSPPLGPEADAAVRTLTEEGTDLGRVAAAVIQDRARRAPRTWAESTAVTEFARAHPGITLVAVPELPVDVHDVPALRGVAVHLFRDGA